MLVASFRSASTGSGVARRRDCRSALAASPAVSTPERAPVPPCAWRPSGSARPAGCAGSAVSTRCSTGRVECGLSRSTRDRRRVSSSTIARPLGSWHCTRLLCSGRRCRPGARLRHVELWRGSGRRCLCALEMHLALVQTGVGGLCCASMTPCARCTRRRRMRSQRCGGYALLPRICGEGCDAGRSAAPQPAEVFLQSCPINKQLMTLRRDHA